MTLDEIKKRIQEPDYDFLRNDKHLGSNIVMIGLGGSYAYGTNVPESDLDIRGCAINTREEILTGKFFEQVTNETTDTTIYSLTKLVKLLSDCNPNTIEMLGLLPEHYLYLSPVGQSLIDNRKMFLSRKAVNSFGGYANQQLRRLDNKSARVLSQEQRELHILNSVKNALTSFEDRYSSFESGSIKLYVDKSANEELDTEIFMDVNLTHYPLRDYRAMQADMTNIVRDYEKVGRRNARAIEHGKLAKHMMHLVRLYLMAFDILEKEEIITYRPEHDFLMEVRAGKFLDNNQPTSDFFDMVDSFEKRLQYAKENTGLPKTPNNKLINEFIISVNQAIISRK